MNSFVQTIIDNETLINSDSVIKALIVENSKMDQMILKKILVSINYEVRTVSTGSSLQKEFIEYQPDIVYMNLNIPDISPQELTSFIKTQSKKKFVPVVYVTSNYDNNLLGQCLDAGGDDFIIKPINEKLLKAKSNSLFRVKKMQDDLLQDKEKLSNYIRAQIKDLHDAQSVINNIYETRYYDSGNMDWSYSAQNILSGDLLCSAINPSGKHLILVGDNTGHGIPAVIGSMITQDIFHPMVEKGFDIQVIIEEINKKLYHLLPTDRFVAACILKFDKDYRSVKIWNAGLPSVFICDDQGELKEKLPSIHFPLGIKMIDSKDIVPVLINLEERDRIYACTDGLTETFNKKGEMYGEDNFLKAIKHCSDSEKRVNCIINDSKRFSHNSAKTDDLLLVEINCDKSLIKKSIIEDINSHVITPMNWSMKFDLYEGVMRESNPVPALVEALVEIQGFADHRGTIFLILTEIYSNALEHGLLGLESSIKDTENGFAKYYELRQARLLELQDAIIVLDINHFVEGEKGILSINLEHNGAGFNHNLITKNMSLNNSNNGRGIGLLYDLCRKYEYSNEGRKCNVEYEWQSGTNTNMV